ncbi:MAG: tryptophan synthase subunit alpha [Myxococcales bacterium]|nr:tryptophan synthase subunit alpha [Myxococcales bacterium]MDD9970800.1 tryptophan synthase subunit alpha [Myxococcales bacterium]
MLEAYIRERRQQRELLLMTHIVLGYPSFDDCLRTVEAMVEAGVDLMELQIPFSEPMADGPVILRANAEALSAGATVERSLAFAQDVARRFDVPFLLMSYYNILFRFGEERFADAMAERNLRGAIVPDLPVEEAEAYLTAMEARQLSPIFLFTPRTKEERMRALAERCRGFVYCVARRGVTGADTRFGEDLDAYLARCRAATDLPLALGFGVQSQADVDFLRGKVDIAVVGSETIRVLDKGGTEAVGPFIRSLRP